MWKVRGFILLVVLLWISGAMGYKAATAAKLRESLTKQDGPGVVVVKMTLQGTYGLSTRRTGDVVFSISAPRTDPRKIARI
ncbi:MAG: hypothetical protein ACKO2G_07235 [Verrucomicrobiales bacterium]